MLALTRKKREKIILLFGETRIEIALLASQDGRARIGIDAPKNVKIYREEVLAEELESQARSLDDGIEKELLPA